MKALLLFCFFLFAVSVNAQNYRLVNPNRISYFKGNSVDYNGQAVFGLRIDSTQQIGNDTLFKNHLIFETYPYSGDFSSCINPLDTHVFFGKFIEQPNGDVLIYNKFNDSIFIQPQISLFNDWTIYTFQNGNKIKGYFNTMVSQNIFGTPDNIKIITIQVEDQLGNPISHNFNQKKIYLSQNHGILKFYNTFEFPNDTTSFNLVGLSNPEEGITNLTAKKIFDWNIGDEFHYHGITSGTSSGYWETYEILKILNRYDSPGNDSTIYTKQRQYYSKNVTFNPSNTTLNISDDTITEVYNWSSRQLLNNLTLETYIDTTPFYSDVTYLSQHTNSIYNGRDYKIAKPWFDVDFSLDSCVGQILGWCIYPDVTYVEGIGFAKRFEGTPCYDNDLVYFSKGTETWGSPISWQTLLSIEPFSSSNLFSLFPNPSSGIISLSTESSEYTIDIINVLGEVVFSSPRLTTNSFQMDLSRQSKGLYFVRFSDKNTPYSLQKLILE